MTTKYYKKIFPNGLTYIFIHQPTSLTTTMLVLVATGSEYETKEISGVSHFLEHLCFKGTEKRKNADVIAEELDSLGAEHNAFTSSEVTGYYAKASNNNFEVIADIISDIYLNTVIDEADMEKERGVIIEEINMYEDLPMDKVRDNLGKLLYGDQPAGWNIAGTKETVSKITKQDILDYRNKHYLGSKTVVVVSGGVSNPEALIESYFNKLPKGDFVKKIATLENQSEPQFNLYSKDTDQVHMVLGLRAFNLFDERRYALSILKNILGGNASSRLFTKIRNEMGAAYYIKSGLDLSSDVGLFTISAGVDKNKFREVVLAIMTELSSIYKNGITDTELKKAKDYISGKFVLQLETSDEIADFYGDSEIMMRQIRTPEEVLARYEAVTREQVLEVARLIIKNSGLNLAAIGPFKDEDNEAIKAILSIDAD